MGRGGDQSAKAKANGKTMGRPKTQRNTTANVAERVLREARAEQLWLSMIEIERRRLGINKSGELSEAEKGAITGPDYQGKFSVIPLCNLLRYLEDRALGRPVQVLASSKNDPLLMNVNIRTIG